DVLVFHSPCVVEWVRRRVVSTINQRLHYVIRESDNYHQLDDGSRKSSILQHLLLHWCLQSKTRRPVSVTFVSFSSHCDFCSVERHWSQSVSVHWYVSWRPHNNDGWR